MKNLKELVHNHYHIRIESESKTGEVSYKDGLLEKDVPVELNDILHKVYEGTAIEKITKEVFALYIDSERISYGGLTVENCDFSAEDTIVAKKLFDKDDELPSEDKIEQWKEGKVQLWEETTFIKVFINGVLIPSSIMENILKNKV
jgi:hypothetical protein